MGLGHYYSALASKIVDLEVWGWQRGPVWPHHYAAIALGRGLRMLLSQMGDPICQRLVRDDRMMLPVSDQLTIDSVRYRYHRTLLPRLCRFIRKKERPAHMIVIGAGIGDAILAASPMDGERVLAVEPGHRSCDILSTNLGVIPKVKVKANVLGPDTLSLPFKIREHWGKVEVERDSVGVIREMQTLDHVLSNDQNLASVKYGVLAIQSGKRSLEILRGARSTVSDAKPAILLQIEPHDKGGYTDDIIEALGHLKQRGYTGMVIYDSHGVLLGSSLLSRQEVLGQLLINQLAGQKAPLELVILEGADFEAFCRDEVALFCQEIISDAHRRAALCAARMLGG
jgi:hypothetical protein